MESKIIYNTAPDDNQVCFDSLKATYYQNPDNCSGNDDYQEITIETKDGGAGNYLNIKTNEHGWSFSDIEDLTCVINHFKNMLK